MISVRTPILLTLIIVSGSKAQVDFTRPPPGGHTITIAEDTPPHTSLYSVEANNHGGHTPTFIVAYAPCVSTNPPSLIRKFTLNDVDALLVPAEGLDAENCTQFEITFTVTAGAITANSSLLTLIVTDINDEDPEFHNLPYSGEVWKNDIYGQTVNESLSISATDGDIVKLPITFSIAGAQTTFAINSSTGTVYVNTPSGLAALASPTTLTIQASDGGRTSSVALVITVHDDPCSSSPCRNGGTCYSTRGDYECMCSSGYIGSKCENVNYCLVNNCQNGGNCSNLANGYKCTCDHGYQCSVPENKNCTYVDYCCPDRCQNGGTCLNVMCADGTGKPCSFTCECPVFYSGQFCEILEPRLLIGIGCTCGGVISIAVAIVVFWRKQGNACPCN